MKIKLFLALAFVSLILAGQCAFAGTTNDPSKELDNLVDKINAKLQAGQKSEKDLADEIKAFDVLLTEHKGEKTDAVALILTKKAALYFEVFQNEDKGIELLKELKRDFPDTMPGKNVDRILAAKEAKAALGKGKKFPGFDEKDVTGKPLSPNNYKGKVLLIDFWATWCPPCMGELPNVLATYEKHHSGGFEIIGVSLDQDQEKLTKFIKQKNMTWQQYFDGMGWSNKLVVKYGIQSIPSTFLLDGEGTIIGKDLRGEELEKAVTEALAKK